MGLQRDEVVARVRAYEGTSQLELDAPDFDKARELLQLVATYVRDGGRIRPMPLSSGSICNARKPTRSSDRSLPARRANS